MSVYIKGIDIPRFGYREIRIYPDGKVTERPHPEYPGYEECLGKAVPVPPHGDLIDRDALEPYMLNGHYGYRLVYDEVDVAHAPTIIPEEGET